MPVNEELRQAIHEGFACASTDPGRQLLTACSSTLPTSSAIKSWPRMEGICSPAIHSVCRCKNPSSSPSHKFLGWKGFNSDGEWKLKTSNGETPLIQISSRRWRWISKHIAGKYPDWRVVVPKAFHTAVELPEPVLNEAITIIERIPFDSSHANKPIRLTVDGNRFTVSGRSSSQEAWNPIEIAGASYGKTSDDSCQPRLRFKGVPIRA